MLQFRLRELLAEKERREGRRIPLRAVSEATGISVQVLSNISSPIRPAVTNSAFIESLCRFFNCPLEELMQLDPEIGMEISCHVDELYPERKN